MSKEDILLFSCYGMRGEGKSYYEKMKEKDKEIERLNNIINEIFTKALDTSITSIDLRDYIISNLGSGKIDKRSNN